MCFAAVSMCFAAADPGIREYVWGKELFGAERNRPEFIPARKRELDAWWEHGAVERVTRTPGMHVLGTRLTHIYKQGGDRKPVAKCRLVIKGFQDRDKDSLLTFSPTVSKTAQRTCTRSPP